MLFKLKLLLLLQLLLAAAGQPEFATAPHRLTKRMDLESCIGHFDVHENTIIRTGESQAIGGKYLQGLELDTLEECERLCCETDACDVYIFERKAGGYCYLFECGPPENFHCKFTRHANYTSAVLTRASVDVASTPRPQLPHIPSNNISQQEWELSNLKLKPEALRDKPTIVVVIPPTASAVLPPGVPQSVAAILPPPESAPAAAAAAGHCGRFQFTCHSGECIAVYNACDGIPQCEDGSDEGPECNAVASVPPKPNSNSNAQSNPEQYQAVPPIQQQLQVVQQQQQHTVQLGPPPPPPPPPPRVNNREDAAAWANRKIIAETQQQQQQQQQQQAQPQGEILGTDEQLNSRIFNHKGGLQLQQQQQQPGTNAPGQIQGQVVAPPQAPALSQSQLQLPVYNSNNNAGGSLYGMSLPRTGIYLTPPQQQQQQQQQQLAGSMPQQSAVGNWPQVAAGPQAQQNHNQFVAAPPAAAAAPQQSMLPVLNAAPTHGKNPAADEDYDDYDDEKSTEAPKKKQRKHKKVKSKSGKDPIELALEQNSQQQSLPPPALPVPVAPVHEQYKTIHENLVLEFRDHDGHSERPGGAVLSLTLGLLVTAALSILIGCRMRTVGRRARRLGGKTPYSQEADFLVNGMYL